MDKIRLSPEEIRLYRTKIAEPFFNTNGRALIVTTSDVLAPAHHDPSAAIIGYVGTPPRCPVAMRWDWDDPEEPDVSPVGWWPDTDLEREVDLGTPLGRVFGKIAEQCAERGTGAYMIDAGAHLDEAIELPRPYYGTGRLGGAGPLGSIARLRVDTEAFYVSVEEQTDTHVLARVGGIYVTACGGLKYGQLIRYEMVPPAPQLCVMERIATLNEIAGGPDKERAAVVLSELNDVERDLS